jgi:hypothetical protein
MCLSTFPTSCSSPREPDRYDSLLPCAIGWSDTPVGYTDEEKEKIAFRFLIPKEIEENAFGLFTEFEVEAVYRIIRVIRGKPVSGVCSVPLPPSAKDGERDEQNKPLRTTITPRVVEEFLGPRKFFDEWRRKRTVSGCHRLPGLKPVVISSLSRQPGWQGGGNSF